MTLIEGQGQYGDSKMLYFLRCTSTPNMMNRASQVPEILPVLSRTTEISFGGMVEKSQFSQKNHPGLGANILCVSF